MPYTSYSLPFQPSVFFVWLSYKLDKNWNVLEAFDQMVPAGSFADIKIITVEHLSYIAVYKRWETEKYVMKLTWILEKFDV